MEIGFTGTRKGMTHEQVEEVDKLLILLQPTKAYHGDCIGADEKFHELCLLHKVPVNIFPSKLQHQRAFCQGAKKVWPVMNPLDRNRAMVNLSDLIIGTPKEDHEVIRSGTWMTLRYAEEVGIPIRVVFPDGKITGYTGGDQH